MNTFASKWGLETDGEEAPTFNPFERSSVRQPSRLLACGVGMLVALLVLTPSCVCPRRSDHDVRTRTVSVGRCMTLAIALSALAYAIDAALNRAP